MPSRSLANGVVVHHAPSLELSAGTQALGARRDADQRRRRGRRAAPRPQPEQDLTPLLRELDRQGFQLVTDFTLAPRPRRPGMRPRRAALLPGALEPSTVDVALADDEDAVVLTVDEFGELDWIFADGTRLGGTAAHAGETTARRDDARRGAARKAAGRRTRGGSAEPRTARFHITIDQPAPRVSGTTRRRGGVGGVLRAVGGWLFKFVRRKVTGLLIKHLEQGVSAGLVRVDSAVPSAWSALGERFTLPTVTLAAGAAPRVLLLVHGTFSSTVGSFGGLGFTVPGVALLHALHEQYDHVLGWDHRTLSETPAQNATAILDALERAFPRGTPRPVIDVIAFSRGGLVTRTLLEQLVPGTRWDDAFKRVVFVASTLGGTLLAQRSQWRTLVTVMTNLAVAACRGVATALPAAAVAAVWVATVARGIAALVRFLASALLDQEAVPGLAAMDPQQRVVQALDRTAPPAKRVASYHAVSNDYEPGGAGAEDASEAMPSALTLKLWDLVMDAQMRQANDLVVHTASMHRVAGTALPSAQTLALPKNGRTMHTTCFRDPDIVARLRAWLIDGEADALPALSLRDDGARRRPAVLARRRRSAGRRRQLVALDLA